MNRASLLLALLLTATAVSRHAAADSGSPAGAPAVSESLPVRFELEKTSLTAEALRLALEQELRVRVSSVEKLESAGLSIRIQRRRATVSFTSEQGNNIERTVELSGDDARSSEIVALLAGNLARDQASELLSRLAPIAPEAPDVPEEKPEPEPEPEPEATEAPPKAESKTAEKAAEPRKPPEPPPAENAPLLRDADAIINLSFYHPITLHAQSERRVFNFEFGAAYSRVGAIEGFGFTIGYLRVRQHLKGAATSLGLTRVDGNVEGVQLAALVTEGHGRLRGYEGANLLTLRFGNVEGVQMSAVAAYARDVEGVQAATAVAVARDVDGVQASVVAAARDVEGAQLGIVSVARDVAGAQLGVVNVARSVDFQLGVVNIVERVDGAAIGLVTVAGNGRVQPAVWGTFDSDAAVNAGVRFIAGYSFSQIGAGYYASGSDPRSEAGGGVHLPWRRARDRSFLDDGFFEVGAHVSSRFTGDGQDHHRMHYRTGLGLRLAGPLSAFGGVELNHELSDFGADVKPARPVFGLMLF